MTVQYDRVRISVRGLPSVKSEGRHADHTINTVQKCNLKKPRPWWAVNKEADWKLPVDKSEKYRYAKSCLLLVSRAGHTRQMLRQSDTALQLNIYR